MNDIYIDWNLEPLTKRSISSRSTNLQDIFPWDITQTITMAALVLHTVHIVISKVEV